MYVGRVAPEGTGNKAEVVTGGSGLGGRTGGGKGGEDGDRNGRRRKGVGQA